MTNTGVEICDKRFVSTLGSFLAKLVLINPDLTYLNSVTQPQWQLWDLHEVWNTEERCRIPSILPEYEGQLPPAPPLCRAAIVLQLSRAGTFKSLQGRRWTVHLSGKRLSNQVGHSGDRVTSRSKPISNTLQDVTRVKSSLADMSESPDDIALSNSIPFWRSQVTYNFMQFFSSIDRREYFL